MKFIFAVAMLALLAPRSHAYTKGKTYKLTILHTITTVDSGRIKMENMVWLLVLP
jgi:hypothetical protein